MNGEQMEWNEELDLETESSRKLENNICLEIIATDV